MSTSNENLNKKLITAVETNKARKVKKLLSKGADPNTTMNKNGLTVLMHAAGNCYEKIAEILLQSGADVHLKTKKEDLTAFLYACNSGCFEIIKMLEKAGADVHDSDKHNKNALMYAVQHKDIELLKFLINKGIDINTRGKSEENILYYASRVINIKTHGKGIDYEFIKQLIELGADINSQDVQGESFLTTAVRSEEIEFVKFVLENGGDADKHGNKAFSVAMYNDSKEIAELLWENINKPAPLIIRYKYETECEQCNRMLSLTEPIKQINCPHCSSPVTIEEDLWAGLFEDSIFLDTGYSRSAAAFSNPGNYEEEVQLERMELLCLNCNEQLNVNDITGNKGDALICGSCSHEHEITDPADWIKTYDVFGLKPYKLIKSADKAKESINLELDCLACGAPMKLTDESSRNYTCEHCGAKQYLTDPVWMKLHPVEMGQYWYLFFK